MKSYYRNEVPENEEYKALELDDSKLLKKKQQLINNARQSNLKNTLDR